LAISLARRRDQRACPDAQFVLRYVLDLADDLAISSGEEAITTTPGLTGGGVLRGDSGEFTGAGRPELRHQPVCGGGPERLGHPRGVGREMLNGPPAHCA